jgi:NAD(P)-dependent dehydrogenase (short-subunit alcohol dehydrogenase family)
MADSVTRISLIITGGGGASAPRIARDVVKNGARVCVADINKDAARAVAGEFGTSAIGVADVTRRDSVRALIPATVNAFGRLDVARPVLQACRYHWRRDVPREHQRRLCYRQTFRVDCGKVLI